MTVGDAKGIFLKKYPDKKLRGYWETDREVVLCAYTGDIQLMETTLFSVKDDGSITPTNPMRSPIIILKKMTEFSNKTSKS